MEIVIKEATIENLKDIQDLNYMLFEKEFDEFDKTLNCKWTYGQEGEEYFKNCITQDERCALVALDGVRIVGYLAGGIDEKGSYRILPAFAELDNMLVLDECRGKGVGGKLHNAFVEWCKSKGVGRMRVVASAKNAGGINFYRKNGFEDYDLVLEKDI